jgi:hypothetical protein
MIKTGPLGFLLAQTLKFSDPLVWSLQKLARVEAEAEKWMATATKAEAELHVKSEQLSNVSYRLDSLLALNEKNSKENPDADKLKELEGRLALHLDAAQTHRAEVEIQKSAYQEKLQQAEIALKVKERELESVRAELKVAHERAFTAEGRLGREQALSRDLSQQLNLLRYGGTPSKPASTPKETTKSTRTELDDLNLDDLDLDIPDVDLPPIVEPVSTITMASVAVASPSTTKKSAAAKQKEWGDIDSLLDDIQATGAKKK